MLGPVYQFAPFINCPVYLAQFINWAAIYIWVPNSGAYEANFYWLGRKRTALAQWNSTRHSETAGRSSFPIYRSTDKAGRIGNEAIEIRGSPLALETS